MRVLARRSSHPSALGAAVRDAARFDASLVSVRSGLLAAIPVVAVLGGAIAAGDAVAAATMGAGAMLVGIAWRTGGGRPPLAMMATDAFLMSVSTFLGCVTGSVTWLHLCVLCVWALGAGLLVAVGRRGAVVGTQAIIALVVFGRFSQPAPQALGLAGFVLAGGLAQVLFLAVVRWPAPLRGQRTATAAAYRTLAALAAATPGTSALPAAAALDEAQDALASPALFGDAALLTLRSLVDEGRRIRIQISAIHALLRRGSDPGAARLLTATARALVFAAETIEGDRTAAEALRERTAALGRPGDGPAPAMLQRRLAGLAGQLRAVAELAPAAGAGGGLRNRRPLRRANRPLQAVRADLDQIRANAAPRSPAGRHALRLAVIVPATELLSTALPLQRSYWMVVAAATVLRPEFTATFTRGAERALGTIAGVALAGAIAITLHPAHGVVVVIVGLLGWAGYAVFPASFAAGFAFITALVVFLLNVIAPDTLATASARLLDTFVGGAIGLAAYALWPTWSRSSARSSLAELAAAQRAYLDGVLRAIVEGRRLREQQIRPLARASRLARTAAEATITLSLSEPRTRRIDADQTRGELGAMRRLVGATHVLRLDAQESGEHRPLPALGPLADQIDALLGMLVGAIEAPASAPSPAPTPAMSPELPDLRSAYGEFERSCGEQPDCAALLAELDEIVDAANTIASLAGLDPVDDAQPQPAARAE